MTESTKWRSRIVGHGEVPPQDLVASPANWRVHGQAQSDALAGVLDEVGWVQDCIVNRRSGTIVDGHLRVALAIQHGEPTIPVVYVELDPAEEALVLATLDPLSAMATTNAEQYDALLRQVETDSAAVQEMLADVAKDAGLYEPPGEFSEYDEGIADEVEYIECPECGHRWPK